MMPSRGYTDGDASCMIDPHRIGRVMWAQTVNGYQVPLDLHNKVTLSDEQGLDRVLKNLLATRKVRGALDIVYDYTWDQMEILKPYLMESMVIRAEARDMIANGDWEKFWNTAD
jgi:hypothetical protein